MIAVEDIEKALEIVHTVKTHFPHLKILSRARGRPAAYDLIDAGVENVYRETLDTSLRVGVDALCALGMRRHQALRAARQFRRHDEGTLSELASMWEDRSAYIVRAREIIRGVEQTIRGEIAEARRHEQDAAWDTTRMIDDHGGDASSPDRDEST